MMQAVCVSCDLDFIIHIVGRFSQVSDHNKQIHVLIHMVSEPPYTTYALEFASKAAVQMFVSRYDSDAKRRVGEFVGEASGNPAAAALCGYLFERHAIGVLEKGGTFACRQLLRSEGGASVNGEERQLTIAASNKALVADVAHDQDRNRLYTPIRRNFPGMDAWIPGVGGLQMTVGQTHRIHPSVEGNLLMLGEGANKLFWVMPPLYYRTFKKQNPYRIDQYAVSIPYPDYEPWNQDAPPSAPETERN
jgi:hypothetical protein